MDNKYPAPTETEKTELLQDTSMSSSSSSTLKHPGDPNEKASASASTTDTPAPVGGPSAPPQEGDDEDEGDDAELQRSIDARLQALGVIGAPVPQQQQQHQPIPQPSQPQPPLTEDEKAKARKRIGLCYLWWCCLCRGCAGEMPEENGCCAKACCCLNIEGRCNCCGINRNCKRMCCCLNEDGRCRLGREKCHCTICGPKLATACECCAILFIIFAFACLIVAFAVVYHSQTHGPDFLGCITNKNQTSWFEIHMWDTRLDDSNYYDWITSPDNTLLDFRLNISAFNNNDTRFALESDNRNSWTLSDNAIIETHPECVGGLIYALISPNNNDTSPFSIDALSWAPPGSTLVF